MKNVRTKENKHEHVEEVKLHQNECVNAGFEGPIVMYRGNFKMKGI